MTLSGLYLLCCSCALWAGVFELWRGRTRPLRETWARLGPKLDAFFTVYVAGVIVHFLHVVDGLRWLALRIFP